MLVGLFMIAAAAGSGWDGPIPPSKFGTAADWAVAFGTVLAVSLALHQRRQETRQASETERHQRTVSQQIEVLELGAEALDEIRTRLSAVDVRESSVDVPSVVAILDEAVATLTTLLEHGLSRSIERISDLAGREGLRGYQHPISGSRRNEAQRWLDECGLAVDVAIQALDGVLEQRRADRAG
jgi:hypothetical protein